MTTKELLKMEIELLDENSLELLYKIARKFSSIQKKSSSLETECGRNIATLFEDIANSGGLDIDDPQSWQREIRQDRPLPFRD